jgi:hypothetical protein
MHLPLARVVVLAILVAGCGAPGSLPTANQSPAMIPTAEATPTRAFTVQIEEGLQVDWNADAAAAATLVQIKASERIVGRVLAAPRIVSVEAWSGIDVPPEIGQGNLFESRVVWVVRAEGTFVAFSCPQDPCPSESSGFVMFDDSGAPLGSGFPLPSPGPAPDCAGVALPVCLTAVAVSRQYDVIKPDDLILAVRVRPTRVKICDGIIEPKLDVTYDLQHPIAIFTVTVGVLPDGRWAACTY